ncbi:MAG: histidine kinase, partial [Planctomycetales bacterium 12-60-4]
MASLLRSRSTLHLPITLSVVLMVLNATLMVCWIVLLARSSGWAALVIGVVVFALILAGLSFYMVLMIKEVRLNQRQANFVDSVTHELKSPIASLRLYLETLQLRQLADDQREKFYGVMEDELERLDHLITQLLEVGRLDAIGQQSEPEEIALEALLHKCGQSACALHKRDPATTITYDLQPARIDARRLVVESVFRNLIDNAIKYGGDPPHVEIQLRVTDRGHVVTRVSDNGQGVP